MARLYTFTNYYMSPIQHGIQTAHIVGDLAAIYASSRHSELSAAELINHLNNQILFLDWAENHKTIIVCNGGNSADLLSLYQQLSVMDLDFPFVKFHEDEQSLNGACTAVGIVLPSKIYDGAATIRNTRNNEIYDASLRGYIPLLVFDEESQQWMMTIIEEDGNVYHEVYTQSEYALMFLLNQYRLA